MTNQDNDKQEGKIHRRDFICKSAAACCLVGLFSSKNGLAKEDVSEGETLPRVRPVDLAAYCGIYCGACDIYQKRIGNAGKELKKVLNAYKFNAWANQVPGLEEYESFDKTLTNLMVMFGQCQGCQKGGGNPQCPIRSCCQEKGLTTCAECNDFPCEILSQNLQDSSEMVMNNLKEIKKIGLEKWSKKEQDKVGKGFRYSTAFSEQKPEK